MRSCETLRLVCFACFVRVDLLSSRRETSYLRNGVAIVGIEVVLRCTLRLYQFS